MSQTFDYDVVVIGAGPAGLTAGMYAGRSMLKTVVLERLAEGGGELLNTELVEDYPGFEHILGRELSEKFVSHTLKFGAELKAFTTVERVQQASGGFETVTEEGDIYRSPTVIVTAGGTPIKLGVPGEIEYAGKGVSYCAICDGAFFRGHTIAVVGGGDAACEEADFLTRYAAKVYLIHRRDQFRASKIIQKRVSENPKIETLLDTVVDEVKADGQGLVDRLLLRNVKTDARRELAATGLFIFVGFRPNTGIIAGHVEHDASGYILTDTNMETSMRGLFAAGDLRSQLVRQVSTAVGDGTTAAIAAEKYLTVLKNREPGGPIESPGGYAV